MGRKRTGWLRQEKDAWYVGLTLRTGKSFEKKIPPPTDGTPYNEPYANKVRATLVHAYEMGTWDPDAPQAALSLDLADPTLVDYVREWARKQTYESAQQDRELVDRYIAPSPFASLRVKDLRPRHMIALVDWLKARPSARGGKLAPRTVRHGFHVVQRALDHAIIDELVASNPCKVVRKHLPAVEDKDPTLRHDWIFTRDEIVRLVTDRRIPVVRRMIYALAFLTGARIGEIIALRVRDYDPKQEPLPRITITRAKKSVTKRIGATKTGATKLVPVHPVLRVVLDAWLAVGWAEMIGRAPGPEDLIVPTKDNTIRDVSHHNEDLQADCKRLGMPERHQHCMRHTFISLAQDDGGDGAVLRWITHAPPRTAFDGYTRGQWSRLCTELAKLNITLPPTSPSDDGTGGRDGPTTSSASIARDETRETSSESEIPLCFPEDFQSGREDLNLRLPGPEPGALPDCATPR